MNKKNTCFLLFLLVYICLQQQKIKADDTVGIIVNTAVVAGVAYVGYKAWHVYKNYTQRRAFEKAQELLKQASFWGNDSANFTTGQGIINALDDLALQGYKPALYFQAEHPWLFVDSVIAEYAPAMHPSEFYARYSRYSIEKYRKLGLMGDVQGYVSAGNLGIAWLYIQYLDGVTYTQIAHDVNEYLGYLDKAACLGHQASVYEIIRIYQEGILVHYNQRVIAQLPDYYHTIQQMNKHIYPLSALKIWLYKEYYRFFNGNIFYKTTAAFKAS